MHCVRRVFLKRRISKSCGKPHCSIEQPTTPSAWLPAAPARSCPWPNMRGRRRRNWWAGFWARKRTAICNQHCERRRSRCDRYSLRSSVLKTRHLLDRHRQRVMVLANKTPQIRPDLAGRVKAGGPGGGFLVLRQGVRAFRIMFEVAKDPDGENVPGGSLIAHKDEVLRLLQCL